MTVFPMTRPESWSSPKSTKSSPTTRNLLRLPRPLLWPRRSLSRKSSAISPKDSRMPRPAPARVKSSHLHWPKTQRSPRKSSAAGWTNTPPSTANSRPLTTKCPDIREPLPTKCPDTNNPVISHRDHPFHFIFFFLFHYINEWFFSQIFIYKCKTFLFFHPNTFFIVSSDCRRFFVFVFAFQV